VKARKRSDDNMATSGITTSEQKTNWFASFSGLIPVLLLVILVLLHQWSLSIIVSLASSLLTIGIGQLQRRKPTSIELLSLLFGIVNADLYFKFHNTFLLSHLGVFIYTLLLVQVVISLIRNKPWTEQYAKRSVPEAVWDSPIFHATNRFLTTVWGVVFAVSTLLSFAVDPIIRTGIPIALLILTAVMTPKLVAWYSRNK
jgi:hypothetical protein